MQTRLRDSCFLAVSVGYQYGDCNEVFWDTQTTSLSGYDIQISEIGGWNLDVHHRYNIREGMNHEPLHRSYVNLCRSAAFDFNYDI